MVDVPFTHGRGDAEDPPLSGKVVLNADRRIIRMEMDGHVQH
jgi:hypothetical protein